MDLHVLVYEDYLALIERRWPSISTLLPRSALHASSVLPAAMVVELISLGTSIFSQVCMTG